MQNVLEPKEEKVKEKDVATLYCDIAEDKGIWEDRNLLQL
jgi:hypothetical protein